MGDNTPIVDSLETIDEASENLAAAVEDAPVAIDKKTEETIHDLIGRIEGLSNRIGETLGENSVRHSELVQLLNNITEKIDNVPETGEHAVKAAVDETEKVLDAIEETPIIQKKRGGMLMRRGKK